MWQLTNNNNNVWKYDTFHGQKIRMPDGWLEDLGQQLVRKMNESKQELAKNVKPFSKEVKISI